MCHRIGWLPIGTIGLGRNSVSSRNRVPLPPHKMTTFIRISPFLSVENGRLLILVRQRKFSMSHRVASGLSLHYKLRWASVEVIRHRLYQLPRKFASRSRNPQSRRIHQYCDSVSAFEKMEVLIVNYVDGFSSSCHSIASFGPFQDKFAGHKRRYQKPIRNARF